MKDNPSEPDIFCIVEVETGRIFQVHWDAEKTIRKMEALNEDSPHSSFTIKINYHEGMN
jgi:hypothetical protein